ncbi:sodium-dependent transporter [Luteithermobacter gelatinilyticus]|uniref:sodium-dependent transporter n=1 Tax=Luteithermobacter gelatinilyticus TaxID=2582913 RepID=UPI001105A37F|nr:sodium-dependent transporter [Luteithermobacter gelatinilyticus]
MQVSTSHEKWSSRLTFIMAAVGSSVGLGNVWKFPYEAGVSGGGAFVLIYIACILVVGLPILIAELTLGKQGQMSPPNTMRTLAQREGRSSLWQSVGWLGVLAAFMILSFYSVIGGWALAYVPKFISGDLITTNPDVVTTEFNTLLASPVQMLAWHGLFMVLTIFVVARGIHAGIEKAVDILMPALFFILLALVIYAAIAGDFGRAWSFLFAADFSKITPDVVLNALGQAFFSISVGLGAMMTYGAYLPKDVKIPRAATIIVFADTMVALLAGLAIFPIVFANGLDPASGPGLVFVTLPLAFAGVPLGGFFGTMFFVLIVFAAITSSISLLEPVVSWAEEHKGVKRSLSAIVAGFLIWLLGLLSVFSFNLWGDVHLLEMFERFETATLFDLMDFTTSNIFLPLGGMAMVIFASWIMSRETTETDLGLSPALYKSWLFLARFVAPIALLMIFAYNIFG